MEPPLPLRRAFRRDGSCAAARPSPSLRVARSSGSAADFRLFQESLGRRGFLWLELDLRHQISRRLPASKSAAAHDRMSLPGLANSEEYREGGSWRVRSRTWSPPSALGPHLARGLAGRSSSGHRAAGPKLEPDAAASPWCFLETTPARGARRIAAKKKKKNSREKLDRFQRFKRRPRHRVIDRPPGALLFPSAALHRFSLKPSPSRVTFSEERAVSGLAKPGWYNLSSGSEVSVACS